MGSDEVEAILNKRVRKKVTEFHVKWKNFDESHNMWLPEDKLNCSELIEEFESRKSTRKKTRNLQPSKHQRNGKTQSQNQAEKNVSFECNAANSETDSPLVNLDETNNNAGLFDLGVQFNNDEDHLESEGM